MLYLPLLWSCGQSSWLQIQRSGFDSRHYQIFWEVVDPERGSLSLVGTIKELLGRNSSGLGLEIREYGRRGSSTLTMRHPLSANVGTYFADKRRHSVGIFRSRTKATEFVLALQLGCIIINLCNSALNKVYSWCNAHKWVAHEATGLMPNAKIFPSHPVFLSRHQSRAVLL
jgi:hypothetical protein